MQCLSWVFDVGYYGGGGAGVASVMGSCCRLLWGALV